MKKYGAVVWLLLFALTLAGCSGSAQKGSDSGQEYTEDGKDLSGGKNSEGWDENGAETGGDDGTAGAVNAVKGEVVKCSHEDAGISLTIPEGWEYAVEEYDQDSGRFGIRFWPEGQNGTVGLYVYDSFGVCGTGLEEQEITFDSGLKGNMGTYDQGGVWDFIAFQDVPGHYIAQTEGADEWWSVYQEEAMEILGSARLGENQTDAVTDFAVRLFQECAAGQENILISPVSVLEALAMTANGADGQTLEQMESVFGMTVSECNRYLYEYENTLPQGEKFQLLMANSVWIRQDDGGAVNPDFLQVNEKWYGAEIHEAPFDGNTLREINQWVDTHTDGMIDKIFDTLSEKAVMYLVNALAFEAEWQEPYEESQVRDGIFTRQDGTTQDVKLMYSEEHDYLRDESGKAQGFIKYYAEGKYAFAALLPDEGVSVSEYIATLDGGRLHTLLENPIDVKVQAAIPEFEASYDMTMRGVLTQMGMGDAFDADKADFTGIGTYPGNNLYISEVRHKTYISVDRKGTKAAAVTGVEMRATSALEPMEIKQVYLDRPFVYILMDCESHTPVFIGVLNGVE